MRDSLSEPLRKTRAGKDTLLLPDRVFLNVTRLFHSTPLPCVSHCPMPAIALCRDQAVNWTELAVLCFSIGHGQSAIFARLL